MPYARTLELINSMKEDLETLVESVEPVKKSFVSKSKARTYRNKIRVTIQAAQELSIDRYSGLLKDYEIQLRGSSIIARRKRGKRIDDRILFPCPGSSLEIISIIRGNKREKKIEFIGWKEPDDFSRIVSPWIKRFSWSWSANGDSAIFERGH